MRTPNLLSATTKSKLTLACSCAALLLAGPTAFAGTFSFNAFNGDANSGISSGLTYTAKADFLGTGTRTVNGVTFADTGLTGAGYSLSGPGGNYTGFGNNLTGNSNGLISDFVYGDGAGNASLTLSGLTVGTQYVTTWYNTGFGNPGGRNIDITPSDTGTAFRFDENYTGGGNGNVLHYSFTATASTITYGFNAVSDGDSFHHYAMTNAIASPLLPVAQITRASGANSPFPVRSDDLLQTHLLSTSSSGNFGNEGAGGVPILNNGIFFISGGNPTDNTQLATTENNSSITFTLDTSVNVLGYDVSSIEGFGGWNDAGRDHQIYSVYYYQVGSPDFIFLGTVDDEPGAVSGISAVRAVFSTALTGVDAVRLNFLPGQENGYAGLGELDVVGRATVPEPASLSLLAMGVLMLAHRRRSAGR